MAHPIHYRKISLMYSQPYIPINVDTSIILVRMILKGHKMSILKVYLSRFLSHEVQINSSVQRALRVHFPPPLLPLLLPSPPSHIVLYTSF